MMARPSSTCTFFTIARFVNRRVRTARVDVTSRKMVMILTILPSLATVDLTIRMVRNVSQSLRFLQLSTMWDAKLPEPRSSRQVNQVTDIMGINRCQCRALWIIPPSDTGTDLMAGLMAGLLWSNNSTGTVMLSNAHPSPSVSHSASKPQALHNSVNLSLCIVMPISPS